MSSDDRTRPENWVVIGAGPTGAAIAYLGSKAGRHVTLIDKAPDAGGLTATECLAVNGETFEVDRFYHVVLESDHRVLTLLEELGLQETVRWTSAPAEIVAGGTRYPATSLANMAMLPMLKLTDRVRIAVSIAASLALPMAMANRMTSATWLRATAGGSAFASFWGPILRAKLGTQADRVSATFVVSTFRRLVQARLKGSGDRFGVLPGGYAPVFKAMLSQAAREGGDIRMDTNAAKVEPLHSGGARVTLEDGSALDADRVFITAPGPVVAKLVPDLQPVEKRQLLSSPYLGVVCGTFLLETPPNDSYITYLVDDVGLTGVIGMHALLPAENTGGAALVYLPHYCAPDDEWFQLSDDQVRERMLAGLKVAFPDFEPIVRASSVNRAPYVVPLPVPHSLPPLPFATSVPGIHVVGTAQNDTGTLNVESSLQLVDEALAGLLD